MSSQIKLQKQVPLHAKKGLHIKDSKDSTYDCISLGEVMLRLDPGETRIHTARTFTAWEGGGEYNVTRGLRRCFKMKTGIVTSLVDNPIGRLIEDFILQGGVSTDFIVWKEDDGVGRKTRNGLNFTERGFGLRGAIGVPDRGNSAASQMKLEDIDWEYLFGKLGVRWFHTGGIFAALSESTPDIIIQAMKIAKKYNTIVSYDLNYRPSLWKTHGGSEAAKKINQEIAQYVDVMIGNEEDFETALGFSISENSNNYNYLDKKKYHRMIDQVVETYPNIVCIAATLRTVKTASVNDWDALLIMNGQMYETESMKNLQILDRVGGGDSFAAGLIYGFLTYNDPPKSLSYGLIHGALAMTTPGDTSMAGLKEIERIMAGKRARVIR